ncbi:ABC transporter ATP-binding protein [Reyranella soli]|jgi:oligopeptide/dipeptide ABC transporter ATP-binding protein|uniref:ABC transporter ATP-binding protein n=1 Tax=Reyranella soli TaxID=1230389 RepID=A0A512NJR2_9HYPH|nr:ABC transporter ATP-binding protein [Reyranella soli]GEP59155.1 ABC transporter ATP-binding protein [Reyranella soli]
MSAPLLSIRELGVSFPRKEAPSTTVVEGVSFDIMPGEIVGIVGESGSGKSMTARSVLRLLPKSAELSGSIRFRGREIPEMTDEEIRDMRGALVSMVFQDPMTSFNPVLRIGDQIGEAIALHDRARRGRRALRDRVAKLLALVGIADPAERARSYPHEFSGGMRQRALTAMAVANSPALLIADEPTTALDVTVQDQVLSLLRELNENSGTAILLITHNIAVVASLCRRVIVMYAGRVIEDGPTDEVLTAPRHPYTWSLLQSVPRIDQAGTRLTAIKGQPPDPATPLAGCKFHPRCPWAEQRCGEQEPALSPIGEAHGVRCWLPMNGIAAAAQ